MKENDTERKIAHCDFCCDNREHEFVYKKNSWNTKNEEMYEMFVTCLSCDWVQNKKIEMKRSYYESLKPVKI